MLTINNIEGVIQLEGQLTRQWALQGFEITPEFAHGQYQVDLGKVDKIDSAGLALLVHWHSIASKSSSSLEFLNIPEKLIEIAELGGLKSVFGK